MANYKNVDVIIEKPIRSLSKPIYSTTFNIRLSFEDILCCILEKAAVFEILSDDKRLRLTLNNYNKDNILGEDPEIPQNNNNTKSFPFISNVLGDDDAPYLVTGNAIKQYVADHGGTGTGMTVSSIDGKTFKDPGASIKFKRGVKLDLPALNLGEPGVAVDEKRLYIGGSGGINIPIPNSADIQGINTVITNIEKAISELPTSEQFQLVIQSVDNKVEKVPGKGLSTNDYTTQDAAEVAKVKDKADSFVVEQHATQIQNLQQQVQLLMNLISGSSNPLTITLTSNVSVAELGSTINSITFNWSYSKDITSQQFDGQSLTSTLRTYTYNTPVTSDKTFTLSATGIDGSTKSATSSIKFLNGVYYGVSASTTYDNALITSLTKVLSGTKSRNITVDAANESDYIYYCIPSRLGIVNFKVGGFDGGFEKVKTLMFTNPSGYSENYDIYRSDNSGLGLTSIDIS